MTDHAFLTVVGNDGTTLITKITGADVTRTTGMTNRSRYEITGYGEDCVQGEDLHSAVAVALAQAYGRPALEVNLVEDLTLGHAEGAHIRVTTKAGIHEGHLSGIRVRHGMDASGIRVRKITDEFVLTVGGADITVEGADRAEVIEG